MLALVPNVKEGSTMTFAYLPGKGTTLSTGNKDLGVFEGKGFADAVFAIWLGPKPPSDDPKKGDAGLSRDSTSAVLGGGIRRAGSARPAGNGPGTATRAGRHHAST